MKSDKDEWKSIKQILGTLRVLGKDSEYYPNYLNYT